MRTRGTALAVATVLCCGLAIDAAAVVTRPLPAVGEVVTAQGDETIRFVDTALTQRVEPTQALAAGDLLKTGPFGALAILFRDETQIRVHRNSTLLVKAVGTPATGGESLFRLENGGMWSRTFRPPEGLRIETPAASMAIRGTDWAVRVDADGRTTVLVLTGVVEFGNELGTLTLARGEQGIAEVGKAPTKTVVVDPKDRPQWLVSIDLGWVALLSLSGETTPSLKAERTALVARASAGDLDAEQRLRLAEVTFDLSDFRASAEALADLAAAPAEAPPSFADRVALVRGRLALAEGHLAEAEVTLRTVSGRSSGRTAMSARLGLFATLVAAERFPEASDVLAAAERDFPTAAEPILARASLDTFYSGLRTEVIDRLSVAGIAFPDDPRFPLMIAVVHLLNGDTDQVKGAADRALARDPDWFLTWNILGHYYNELDPDPEQAKKAFETAVAVNPHDSTSWNNLGLVLWDRGDYREADAALQTAVRLAPRDSLPKANSALFWLFLERVDRAAPFAAEAIALEPDDPAALLAQSVLALSEGRSADAVTWADRAMVASPALAGVDILKGFAEYQEGRVDAAVNALQNAVRKDPEDPVPSLILSVIAQDQAMAGDAIRWGREAFRKYDAARSISLESLASTRSGISNLGSAYTLIGLDDWGRYYGQLADSPYIANSYFFLAPLYPSANARFGAEAQGLLLDPLAVAAPTRYTWFIRRPADFPVIGGGAGSNDGSLTWNAAGTAQGFHRLPMPAAYNVSFLHTNDDGYRVNGFANSTLLSVQAGLQPTPYDNVYLGVFYGDLVGGQPGAIDSVLVDDDTRVRSISAQIGYQHRFAFDNRVLARAAYQSNTSKFRSDNPFGSGLSNFDYSLLQAFGINDTNFFHEQGLFDATALLGFPPNNPVLIFGPLGPFLGLPGIPSTIPADLNPSPFFALDNRSQIVEIDVRHLFDLGPLSLTYGFEGFAVLERSDIASLVPQQLGTAQITDGFIPAIPFPFVTPTGSGFSSRSDQLLGQLYAKGTWHVSREIDLEAGIFLGRFEDGVDSAFLTADPRVGISWRVTPRQLLRLAWQRQTELGGISTVGTLAPVATVGLVVPDIFAFPVSLAGVFDDGIRSTDLQLRWDTEWAPRLFTFATLERQTFGSSILTVPLGGVFEFPAGERRAIAAGANVWFLDRFGFAGQVTVQDSTNTSASVFNGKNLPLVSNYLASTALTYVDPRQIYVTVGANFVGRRAADVANSSFLAPFATLNASINWQPQEKHWSLTLAALNLLDQRFDFAAGFPAAGRVIAVSAEYRF